MFAERTRAALLGLALGDAYGRSLEFVSGDRVRTRPVVIPSSEFMWTDDTHMSLYLVEALAAVGRARLRPLSEDDLGRAVGDAFVRWSHDPLTPSTAPGNTCLAGAAAFESHGDWRTSGVRRSDGCGAVMRIAPLPALLEGADLVAAARVQALVTHAHPNAPAAAVAACLLLRDLLEGAPLAADTVKDTLGRLRDLPESTETVESALEAALEQAVRPDLEWLDEAGIPDGDGGWRSPSALGLALVAALRWGDDFSVAVEKAARIDGDSDSVACLAGMFVGAARGMGSLPTAWLDALPSRERIQAAAETLLALAQEGRSPAPAGARTSRSHPIRVAPVRSGLGSENGRLGVTFAPGKHATSLSGPDWHRDLGADLDRLRGSFEVDVLVSLIEDHELTHLQIPDLVAQAEARGIAVLRLGVPDGGTPTLSAARRVVQHALSLARSGRHVVFHCRGGLGRAGTLAACALISLGSSPAVAMKQVRRVRPGAIENSDQERFLRDFAGSERRSDSSRS